MSIILPNNKIIIPQSAFTIPPISGDGGITYTSISTGSELVLESESVYLGGSICPGVNENEFLAVFNFSSGVQGNYTKYYSVSGTTITEEDSVYDSDYVGMNYGSDIIKMDDNVFWQVQLRGGVKLRKGSWDGSDFTWGSWSSSLESADANQRSPNLVKVDSNKCILYNSNDYKVQLRVISESGGTFSSGTTVDVSISPTKTMNIPSFVWDDSISVGTLFYNSAADVGILRCFTVSGTTVSLAGSEVAPTIYDGNARYHTMPILILSGNGRIITRSYNSRYVSGTASVSGFTEGTSGTYSPLNDMTACSGRACLSLSNNTQGIMAYKKTTSQKIVLVDSVMNEVSLSDFSNIYSNTYDLRATKVIMIAETKGVLFFIDSTRYPRAVVFDIS